METTKEQLTRVMERMLNMLNLRDFDVADDLYARDYDGIDLTSQTQVRGPAEAARALEQVCAAFPDLRLFTGQTIFDTDRVVVYWTAQGTHQAMAFNLPPTGRPVTVNGVSLLRVADGKLVHGVHLWDMAALLRAVGLLPELENKPVWSSPGVFQSSS